MGHLPVRRSAKQGESFISQATELVSSGRVLGIFPEGTTTREEKYWPMTAKTGAAKIALASSAPIYPVVFWGTQHFLPRYSYLPRFWARPRIVLKVLDPITVDLDTVPSTEYARVISNEITKVLTNELAKLRGEPPRIPSYDLRVDGDPWGKVPRSQLVAQDTIEIKRQLKLARQMKKAREEMR
ncbi:hypothetical protein BK816_02990 [Boudabousia tangfeifanii]|uniref:Phospholipid/glycerol acyltransferase domain-containing protein n=2 Tax=Boudabousia tangfeifanii TaxID=1912795 RepID=A0A1D9MJA7_9ACTO|nr:hypothetical protein BK816_02990 [Boudabousia tangfeifanii]